MAFYYIEPQTKLDCVEGGSITSHPYITEIRNDHVVPFASFLGNNFIVIQDNARPSNDSILDCIKIHPYLSVSIYLNVSFEKIALFLLGNPGGPILR